jgi:hypothetical protein
MAFQLTSSAALTITAGSLGSAAARSSAAVTTSVDKNVSEILLTVSVLTTTTAPTGNKQVVVYAYTSEDGTNFNGNSGGQDDVDGTDKALTALGSPTNLIPIGTIQLNQGANARTIRKVFELTQYIGIPAKWGIVLYNDAGTALGATVSASYREGYYT